MGNTNTDCPGSVHVHDNLQTPVHSAADRQDALLLLGDLLDGCHATAAERSATELGAARAGGFHVVVYGVPMVKPRLDVQLHGLPSTDADYDAAWTQVRPHLKTTIWLNIDAFAFVTDAAHSVASPPSFDALLDDPDMARLHVLHIRGLPLRIAQIVPISRKCSDLYRFRTSIVGPPVEPWFTKGGAVFRRLSVLELEWWLREDQDAAAATEQCARATFDTVLRGGRETPPTQTLETMHWTTVSNGTGASDWPLLPTVQALLPPSDGGLLWDQLSHVRICTGSMAPDAATVVHYIITQCMPTDPSTGLERTVEIVVPRGWSEATAPECFAGFAELVRPHLPRRRIEERGRRGGDGEGGCAVKRTAVRRPGAELLFLPAAHGATSLHAGQRSITCAEKPASQQRLLIFDGFVVWSSGQSIRW